MNILKKVQLQHIKGGDSGAESDENRSYQTISNVMKNRTDTAKNSIRNIN